MNDQQQIDLPLSLEDQLKEISKKASTEDLASTKKIIDTATSGNVSTAILSITPPVAAMLIERTNRYNRELRLPRAKEYLRQMTSGMWKTQGQGIQFFVDGILADGQHRLLALALAGLTHPDIEIQFTVYFGLEKDSLDIIDLGVKRTPADAANLEGIKYAAEKVRILKSSNTYLKKIKLGLKLDSPQEVKDLVIDEDETLSAAIAISLKAEANIVKPTISRQFSSAIAYTLLKCDWQEDEIENKLRELQQGFSFTSDQAPIYVATEYIGRKDVDNAMKWMIVLKAFILAKKGATAVRPREFAEIKKKPAPNPKTLSV